MNAIIKVKIYTKHTKTQMLRQALGNTRFVWNNVGEEYREIQEGKEVHV